jgi:serine/threonine-protein kinase ATR
MYVQWTPFLDNTKRILVIIAELEAVRDPSTPLIQSFRVTIPSPSCIGAFWTESQQFVAIPHELQRTVSSQIAAIYIGFSLLLALIGGSKLQKGQCTDFSASENHQPWVLDTCLVLWQHFRRWTTGSEKGSLQDGTVGLYLEVLQTVLGPTKDSEVRVSRSAKSAQSLIRGLASLLEKPNLSAPNQLKLALLLVRSRTVVTDLSTPAFASSRRRVNSSVVIIDDLETSIAQLCHDTQKLTSLQRVLQVGVALDHHN